MAHHDRSEHEPEITDPAQYWDDRYSGPDNIWTGHVNKVLAEVAGQLPVGRALDLGCGEGGDVIWLAKQGWQATGIDISANAIARARKAAESEGLTDNQARFIAGDLSELALADEFSLVSASFFQSPVALDRFRILRQASQLISAGGYLLLTSHAIMPHHPDPEAMVTPEQEVAGLALDPDAWRLETAELRTRTHTFRDGDTAELSDSVVLYQRL